MPSITSWARLEPQCAGTDIEPGLAARIHDPLWLMARQWQLGEYLGEDTGTPIVARWRGQVAMLNRCHLGAAQPNTQIQTERYDGNRMPLETLVERQRIQPAASAAPSAEGLRLAVEGGQHFLRLLRAQPTAGGDYGEAFIAAYAVPAQTKESIVKTTPFRSDEKEITIAPHEGLEIKAHMKTGDHFIYTWTASAPVKADMHGEKKGDTSGDFTQYWKEKGLSEDRGALTAPFEGTHGWYFRNQGEVPLTVKVKTWGFYEDLFEPKH